MKTFLLSLLILTSTIFAADVQVIKVTAKKMQRDIPVTVILPKSYSKNSTKKYAVIYLLHGAGGQHSSWTKHTKVNDFVDKDDIIVVCPDAGRTSWYFDSPIDKNYQYESFVAKDLIKYIDKNYRTIARRKQRALAGFSMGGHGAMFLAMRHQKTFSAAASFSGGVDFRPFANKWDIKKRLGPMDQNKKLWDKMTVIEIAKKLKNKRLALSFTCGDKDFFLEVNRALHQQLKKQKIKHKYVENKGAHDWRYINQEFAGQWNFLRKHLSRR